MEGREELLFNSGDEMAGLPARAPLRGRYLGPRF